MPYSVSIGCERSGDGGGGRLVGELVAAWHPLRCVQSAAAQIPPVGGVPCTGRGVPSPRPPTGPPLSQPAPERLAWLGCLCGGPGSLLACLLTR